MPADKKYSIVSDLVSSAPSVVVCYSITMPQNTFDPTRHPRNPATGEFIPTELPKPVTISTPNIRVGIDFEAESDDWRKAEGRLLNDSGFTDWLADSRTRHTVERASLKKRRADFKLDTAEDFLSIAAYNAKHDPPADNKGILFDSRYSDTCATRDYTAEWSHKMSAQILAQKEEQLVNQWEKTTGRHFHRGHALLDLAKQIDEDIPIAPDGTTASSLANFGDHESSKPYSAAIISAHFRYGVTPCDEDAYQTAIEWCTSACVPAQIDARKASEELEHSRAAYNINDTVSDGSLFDYVGMTVARNFCDTYDRVKDNEVVADQIDPASARLAQILRAELDEADNKIVRLAGKRKS